MEKTAKLYCLHVQCFERYLVRYTDLPMRDTEQPTIIEIVNIVLEDFIYDIVANSAVFQIDLAFLFSVYSGKKHLAAKFFNNY